MKSNFPLFVCVNFFLLSLVIARSAGGVANPKCKKGKFFDRSRQEYLSCHVCKWEIQECFTCCQSEAETQGDGRNTQNVNASWTTHPRAKDSPPAKIESFLPNVLVVSTVSVVFVASLVVLFFVVIRSSSGRSDGTNEAASSSQSSEVVTEVRMMDLKDEIVDSNTLSDATLTSNSKTSMPTHTTKPTVPNNTGSDVVATLPNPVATEMKIFIIIGFILIGFLTVLGIAGSLALANKCCTKKKKWKMRSSNIKLGMQETQLSTSSPMAMGHPLGEPVPQSLEVTGRE